MSRLLSISKKFLFLYKYYIFFTLIIVVTRLTTSSLHAQQPCQYNCSDDGIFAGRNFFRYYNTGEYPVSFWFEGYDTLTLSSGSYKYFKGNIYSAEIRGLAFFSGYTRYSLKMEIDKILRQSFWRRVGDGIIKWKSTDEFAALLNELRKIRNVPYTQDILATLEDCDAKLNYKGLNSEDREVYNTIKEAVITIVTRHQWDLIAEIKNCLNRYVYRKKSKIELTSQFEITKQLRWQIEHSRTIGGPSYKDIPNEYVVDQRNFPPFSSFGLRLNFYRDKKVNTNPRFLWSLEYIKSGLSYFDPADTNIYKGFSWHHVGIKNGYLHMSNISKKNRPGNHVALRLEYGLQLQATRQFEISQDSTSGNFQFISGPIRIKPNNLGLNLGVGLLLSIKHIQVNLSINSSRPLIKFETEFLLSRYYFLSASVAYPIKSKVRLKYKITPNKFLEN